MPIRRTVLCLAAGLAALGLTGATPAAAQSKDIVYITPGLDLPFWRYLAKGVEKSAKAQGYGYQVLDSKNSSQVQLQAAQDAISRGVAGIVLSPTESSSAPSVLQMAQKAGIPVVIADIGTESGDYVSFIISDNYDGAKGAGEALAKELQAKGWQDGSVGIVSISQARLNGQARTKGFKDAMAAAGIAGDAGLQQMQTYTADETFRFTQDMLTANPGMRGLFVQTDQPSVGAIRAIKAARRQGEVAVAAFDGIPEMIPMLESGDIVASGMQQPHLMGEEAGKALIAHLKGETPAKEILVPIVVVTQENLKEMLPVITETVFANEL